MPDKKTENKIEDNAVLNKSKKPTEVTKADKAENQDKTTLKDTAEIVGDNQDKQEEHSIEDTTSDTVAQDLLTSEQNNKKDETVEAQSPEDSNSQDNTETDDTQTDDTETESTQSKTKDNKLKQAVTSINVALKEFMDKNKRKKKIAELKKKSQELNKLNNKDELKKYLMIPLKKDNLALTLSIIALATALYTLNQASLSKARVFLDSESALSEKSVNFSSPFKAETETKKEKSENAVEKNMTPNASAATNTLNSKEMEYMSKINSAQSQGIVFKDEKAFRESVQKAIMEIKKDESRLLMEGKFKKFDNAVNAVPSGRRIYGNPEARFIIKEFSDLECGYCKDFFSTPKEVADLSDSQVAVEWIHTPLSFHDPAATQEAIAAECVFDQKGNKAFWVALQHIFDTTSSNGQGSAHISKFPELFDLDKEIFIACLNNAETMRRVDKFKEQATAAGVTGTPAVLIEDTLTGKVRFLGGAQPSQAIMLAIEELNEEAARETVIK